MLPRVARAQVHQFALAWLGPERVAGTEVAFIGRGRGGLHRAGALRAVVRPATRSR